MKKQNHYRTNVYLFQKSPKTWYVMDSVTNEKWANERFKTEEEAKLFVYENKLSIVSPDA